MRESLQWEHNNSRLQKRRTPGLGRVGFGHQGSLERLYSEYTQGFAGFGDPITMTEEHHTDEEMEILGL